MRTKKSLHKRVLAATAAVLLVLATAASASADASGKASCVGQILSGAQPAFGGLGQQIKQLEPGQWGEAVSNAAKADRTAC